MQVRAKKALGQHFLTDQKVARNIVNALVTPFPSKDLNEVKASSDARPAPCLSKKDGKGFKVEGGSGESYSPVLEVGPGMGVLTQYLLEREDIDLRLIEIDTESVEYLLTHFQGMQGRLMEGDFLQLKLEKLFPDKFAIIGNFPYNISSQIFFKVLDYKDRIPEVVGMVQKEVAERIAEKPGSKTYGILSVLLQAWYNIEYLFTVGSGCFAPPPKVESAVIRITRNSRTELGCDENLFKTVVKTAFGQRRKMMRNPLKPIALARGKAEILSQDIFSRRPEQLSVEDFVALTNLLD